MSDSLIISPVIKAFLAGSFSGTCSTILFQPLDLVKTRLQAKHNVAHGGDGMLSVIDHVVRRENFGALWRGMTPSMMRCVPGVGMYFSSLHALKSIACPDGSSPGPLKAAALGVAARTVSGVIMIPMTVVKTRFESGVFGYSGIRHAVHSIYTKEGVRGLTCGLMPTLLRDAPFSGLYLMFYTQIKRQIPQEFLEGSMSSPCNFSCGVVSGLLASILTQPFDVVKTKMQLYPNTFTSVPQVVVYVYRRYGYTGYFKGLAPRMLRRTLIAAMAWTVYEKVMQSMQLK